MIDLKGAKIRMRFLVVILLTSTVTAQEGAQSAPAEQARACIERAEEIAIEAQADPARYDELFIALEQCETPIAEAVGARHFIAYLELYSQAALLKSNRDEATASDYLSQIRDYCNAYTPYITFAKASAISEKYQNWAYAQLESIRAELQDEDCAGFFGLFRCNRVAQAGALITVAAATGYTVFKLVDEEDLDKPPVYPAK